MVEYIKKYFEKKIKDILTKGDNSNLIKCLKKDRKKIIDNLNKIVKSKKVLIIGDKDVDGITSTTMLKYIIKNLIGNRKVHTYIPSRYDGYSITFDIAKELIESEEYDLIINLDNGSSLDYLEGIIKHQMNKNFLIIDHHPIGEINYDYDFIINPNLKGDISTSTGLLIGYIFDVIKNYEKVKNINLFKNQIEEDFFDELRLLSALGDMVSKNSLYNRKEILKGLDKIKKSKRFLFKNISQNCLDGDYIAYINFNVIPLINTLGRLGTTEDINSFDFETLFFEEKDKQKFYNEYDKLLELNAFRKEITNHFYKIAINELNSKKTKPSVFVFYNENMPIGLNGIIAQKIYQTKGIPTISISPHPFYPEKLYGSARGENIKNIFNDFLFKNSLKINYGGHIEAFGLNMEINELNKLKEIENFKVVNNKEEINIINTTVPINMKQYKEILDYLFYLSKDLLFDFNEELLIEINEIKLLKKYNDMFALVDIDGVKGFINPELINSLILEKEKLFALKISNSKNITYNLNNFKNDIITNKKTKLKKGF